MSLIRQSEQQVLGIVTSLLKSKITRRTRTKMMWWWGVIFVNRMMAVSQCYEHFCCIPQMDFVQLVQAIFFQWNTMETENGKIGCGTMWWEHTYTNYGRCTESEYRGLYSMLQSSEEKWWRTVQWRWNNNHDWFLIVYTIGYHFFSEWVVWQVQKLRNGK